MFVRLWVGEVVDWWVMCHMGRAHQLTDLDPAPGCIPTRRHMTNCEELNDKVQREIEKAINEIDADGNGLLSREEMVPPHPSS